MAKATNTTKPNPTTTSTKTNPVTKPIRSSKRSASTTRRGKQVAQTGDANAASKSSIKKAVSGLDLAASVVAKANEPLNAKSIAEQVIAAGWQTKGQTPHATLYASMIREIEKKGKASRFKKVGRGRFAFNDQTKASQ